MFLRWMAGITSLFLNIYIVVVVTCCTLVSTIIRTLVGTVLSNPMCPMGDRGMAFET